MNKRGNILLSFMFFILALGVVVVFISPIKSFVDLMQQSDSLNCKGFIYNGNSDHQLSFNTTLDGGASGDPLSCLAIRLYLPYILLVFLMYGIFSVLGNRTSSWFGFGENREQGF